MDSDGAAEKVALTISFVVGLAAAGYVFGEVGGVLDAFASFGFAAVASYIFLATIRSNGPRRAGGGRPKYRDPGDHALD